MNKAQLSGLRQFNKYDVGPIGMRFSASELAFWLSVVALAAWAVGFISGVIVCDNVGG